MLSDIRGHTRTRPPHWTRLISRRRQHAGERVCLGQRGVIAAAAAVSVGVDVAKERRVQHVLRRVALRALVRRSFATKEEEPRGLQLGVPDGHEVSVSLAGPIRRVVEDVVDESRRVVLQDRADKLAQVDNVARVQSHECVAQRHARQDRERRRRLAEHDGIV